jgi:hypothetical protein
MMRQIFVICALLSLLAFQQCRGTGEYILNTSKCKIPNIDAFNEEVKSIMQPSGYISCNASELLTYVTKTNTSAVLHLRKDLLPQYSPKEIKCCYSYVSRNGSVQYPDEGITMTKCKRFREKVLLKYDSVMVNCTEFDEEKNLSRTVYENVHNPILVKDSLKEKLKSGSTKPISVLLVVVDSISRLNFIRTMPQSYDFLLKNDFVEMKGYTKVDDNTFPNAMAFLTGFNLSKSYQICKPGSVKGLNHCPMIWYDYRNLGYVTAYAEDDTPIGTFNYQKKGFAEPPTDYYFKPHLEASETLKIVKTFTMPYCTGPESAGERVLNLAKDFAITFKNHSSFGMFWMNTFSHNDINAPYGMDTKVKQFFLDIRNAGVLNDSIVIFLSDHGVRYGNIRATQSGWFEERMPVNMISVPKHFRMKFNRQYKNLKDNSNKLTSTYDLYMTLQHILTLSGLSYNVTRSSSCPKCVSLFQKIPTRRSCKDAGIPFQWCTCMGHFHTIDSKEVLARNATELALTRIKNVIRTKFSASHCVDYSLEEILSASISESVSSNNKMKHLFVVFKTTSQNVFLTTVKFKQFVNINSTFYAIRFNNMHYCITRSQEKL